MQNIRLPAAFYYEKHPQAKPLFIAALVLSGINFVVFMVWRCTCTSASWLLNEPDLIRANPFC